MKFAVKEIKYKETKMDVDEGSNVNHANAFASSEDDFEEYEEVESIMQSLPEEE